MLGAEVVDLGYFVKAEVVLVFYKFGRALNVWMWQGL